MSLVTRATLFESSAGQVAVQNIIRRGEEYWQANIYRYYQAHTGRLGKSCIIRYVNNNFIVGMKPLIDYETGSNYGSAIRRGIPAGEGAYDPKLGKRKHTGYFPGVSVTKFWLPWMADFRPAFRRIVAEETRLATKQYIKQVLKGQV